MKFFKMCTAILAISGVAYVGAMEDASTTTPTGIGSQRGGYETQSADAEIIGVVRALLSVDVGGFSKVLNLYTEGGDITDEDERTIVFNVKNVGTRYSIKFSGQNGLLNEDLGDHHWTMKGERGDNKIGIDISFTPVGAEPQQVDSQDPIEFQGDWKSGDWKMLIDPQELSPETVIDTYKGKVVVQIEAND